MFVHWSCVRGNDYGAAFRSKRKTIPQPQNHGEHTKLLTVGSLVKWRGNVYEITGFKTYDNDNLTYATISDERWSADVPVEDLEEVGNSD